MAPGGRSMAPGMAPGITESVFASNPDTTEATPIAMNQAWYVSPTSNQLVDAAEFARTESIWVQKDIIVSGGQYADGLAHLSIFYQTFPQAPEPCMMALLGAGLAMLLQRKRN